MMARGNLPILWHIIVNDDKSSSYKLASISNYDLGVGASFEPGHASIVTGARRDACVNIQKMPAQYITYPGQNRPLFECETRGVKKSKRRITLSKDYLQQFGTFRVPTRLWQTLGQYACWLELAILREWSGLTQGWGVSDYRSVDMGVFE